MGLGAIRCVAVMTAGLVVVLGSVVALGDDAPEVVRAEWNVRDHIPVGEIFVQSHRGAGKLAPENTLVAFRLAWKLGTIPEADLRTTKDGVVVAFHDKDFGRVVKGVGAELRGKGVSDLTWAEVKKLDVGAWMGEEFVGCRVPSLSEIIDEMKGDERRRLYVDIKKVDLEVVSEAVTRAGVDSRVILASTKYELIREWKKLTPKSGTLHWMGGSEEVLAERIAKLREVDFADITQLQIHVRYGGDDADGSFIPSASFLVRTGDELREHGVFFQALPLGRSDAAVYGELMDLGVVSFATDYPRKTMKAIRDYYRDGG